MTHANLKSKLNTLATTGGFSKFHYGWLDEFDCDNREGTYPALIVIPINRPLKTRTGDYSVKLDVEMYALNNWKREDTGSRETAYDTCDTKFLAFLTALASSSEFSLLNPSAVPIELYPFGLSTDSIIAIKYTVSLEIIC